MLFRNLLHTPDDSALAILRGMIGVVFFAHGAQKMLGWFGGPGFDATMQGFTQVERIPAVFAALAILAEFLGGIGLVLGLLSRVAAFGIAVNMVVAVVLVHHRFGFWAGSPVKVSSTTCSQLAWPFW